MAEADSPNRGGGQKQSSSSISSKSFHQHQHQHRYIALIMGYCRDHKSSGPAVSSLRQPQRQPQRQHQRSRAGISQGFSLSSSSAVSRSQPRQQRNNMSTHGVWWQHARGWKRLGCSVSGQRKSISPRGGLQPAGTLKCPQQLQWVKCSVAALFKPRQRCLPIGGATGVFDGRVSDARAMEQDTAAAAVTGGRRAAQLAQPRRAVRKGSGGKQAAARSV